jgi:AraC family transcriptional regulator of arabinose operon
MSDISNPAKQTDPVEQDIPALEDYRLFFPETDRFPELRLRHCGYEKCAPGHSFGPAVRGSFLIHIVLEGRGSYMVNQQTYRLGAGDGFLILPELQTFYKADDDDPWTYVWIGFEGRSAEDVIHDMGLGRESLVFHSSRPQDLRSIVREMFLNREPSRANLYRNQSLLLHFFSILLSDMEVMIGSPTGRNRIVSQAVQYIEDCYGDSSVKVAQIAKNVNVERGYLYSLFMKHLGLSPQEYLLKFRLTKATDLLNHTDLPIDKIASGCGYQDPVTFSKAFRKMFGMPPGKYRKVSRERMRISAQQYDSRNLPDKETVISSD